MRVGLMFPLAAAPTVYGPRAAAYVVDLPFVPMRGDLVERDGETFVVASRIAVLAREAEPEVFVHLVGGAS